MLKLCTGHGQYIENQKDYDGIDVITSTQKVQERMKYASYGAPCMG